MKLSRRLFVSATALVALFALDPAAATAQVPLDRGVTGTALLLRQLDGVKRVLMIAAHPDDEDTALLATLARGMGAETAYLSLTRGDGGQNLVGPELGEGLGVIRTGELVAARELDGAGQFFSRAFDFGYSKNAEEALSLWPRDELLRDVVYVIRTFRPQVIVARFTGTPADGHGQHQASGIMALEGFEAAANPDLYPELGLPAWQATKLYQTRRGGGQDGIETSVETGTFDPVLGRSTLQIAMDSRSQHRSQDMGSAQPLGGRTSDLVVMRTAPGVTIRGEGFFDGVDTTLVGLADAFAGSARTAVVEHLEAYRRHVVAARENLSVSDPSAIVPHLAAAAAELVPVIASVQADMGHGGEELRARHAGLVVAERLRKVSAALNDAAGIVTRVRVSDDLAVPGDDVDVILEVWNGGPWTLNDFHASLDLPEGWETVRAVTPDDAGDLAGPDWFRSGMSRSVQGPTVAPGEIARYGWRVTIPEDADLSRLYYRATPREGEMYTWPDDPASWARPKNPPVISGFVGFRVGDEAPFTNTSVPATYVGVDQAFGEFEEPLLIVPAVSVRPSPAQLVWPAGAAETKRVSVELDGLDADGAAGRVHLEVPRGWSVSPESHEFSFAGPGQSAAFAFEVTPSGAAGGRHVFEAVATLNDGRSYREGVRLVDYPHIERTPMFDPAEVGVTVVPVAITDAPIGYVPGAGDDGMLALEQMGADVEVVTAEQLAAGDLDRFRVLVLGIRVYETRPEIVAANDRILEFARNGGTVVVQYNQYGFPPGGYAPYRVDMTRPHTRTTDENSPVRFLQPDHAILNSPNRITEADFEGWVQERGLYYLSEWDAPFEPVIAFRDPGEEWAEGSILVAPVGEGVYVYTGISFFRQFPAGVAGAYRLFANLVSLTADGVAN